MQAKDLRFTAVGYASGVALPGLLTVAVRALPNPPPGAPGYAYLHLGGVVLVALIFGAGPAVVAALLSTALIDYFFVPPVGQLAVAAPADLANLALFMLAALVVGALVDARRRQQRRLRELADSLRRGNAELEQRRQDAEAGRRAALELATVSARVEALAEADRLKSELLANVSHQLRTPLGAIVGMSSALLDPDGAPEVVVRQYVETINAEGRRLAGLVGDLLEMARLESGGVQLQLEPLDALEALRSAAERAEHLDPGLQVEVAGEAALAIADDAGLQEALRNLVENASRYSDQVELACTPAGEAVRLSVADRGPGVPEEQREAIFDRFHQGHEAGALRRQAGSGLGLAICRRLVEAMSGRVWCEPRPGGGATFVIELRGFAGAPPAPPERDAAAARKAESG